MQSVNFTKTSSSTTPPMDAEEAEAVAALLSLKIPVTVVRPSPPTLGSKRPLRTSPPASQQGAPVATAPTRQSTRAARPTQRLDMDTIPVTTVVKARKVKRVSPTPKRSRRESPPASPLGVPVVTAPTRQSSRAPRPTHRLDIDPTQKSYKI